MKYRIGDWTIVASIDEDKHLTLSVENSDNSRVIIMNSDIGEDEFSWGDRFTTENIESEYIKSINN